ncbi:hypothetical protein AMS68_005106 [Peltaster fructicola]|uniref:UFSP1/2/DUB catalytic domain-containing protein n=1 Tax=Peltaster fructicola TaxID=286661 RepID=A0A6H0XY93_9PEZI|nr:hypothetical protein AMS68_005106 [Peltaster fructicola]
MHESMDASTGGLVKGNLEPGRIDAKLIRKKAIQASHARSTRSATSSSNQNSILSYLAGGRPVRPRPPLQQRRDRGRLGTKELGPHAFEKSMPSSVRRVLENAARPVAENRISSSGRITRHIYYPNETTGLIPILADLCVLDDTATTYLSHTESKHIHRIRCDGNFCGYWNIQMLLSHVLTTTNPQRGLPTVLQIQDEIEKAWSNNICAYGRVETGGVFNTRKWIGTHEAMAFFQQIDIPVSASSFQRGEQSAYRDLLDFVETYYLAGLTPEFEGVDSTTVVTRLPPIYLQRAGHSLTIVGLTRHSSSERSLIIFDPSHDTTPTMSRLLTGRSAHATPHSLLQPYLWSEARLAAWDEYETLT